MTTTTALAPAEPPDAWRRQLPIWAVLALDKHPFVPSDWRRRYEGATRDSYVIDVRLASDPPLVHVHKETTP